MKRLFTLIAAGALLLTMALPASAQAVTDVVEDVDKHIAAGATVGSQTFTISATFTPAGPGAQMGEGIGFYYQNGDGTPPQSFYRVVLWRDNGSDAGADRLDFYCEKQYNDKHVGNVPASINGVAADDPDINEEFRYISTDWGWYAAADAAYKMDGEPRGTGGGSDTKGPGGEKGRGIDQRRGLCVENQVQLFQFPA